MLPVSDFNFMVAGIATFAATVGYTYARGKLNSTTTGATYTYHPQQKDEEISVLDGRLQVEDKRAMEAGPSSTSSDLPIRRASLKRKEPHDGFEENETQLGYPFNLAQIYPRKRCRTPSSGKAKEKSHGHEASPLLMQDSFTEDWIFVRRLNSPSPLESEPPRTPSPGVDSAAPTPATEVTESPLLTTNPMPFTEDSTCDKPAPLIEPKEPDCAKTPEILLPASEQPQASDVIEVELKKIEAAAPPEEKSGQTKASAFGKTSPFTPIPSIPKIPLQKPIASPYVARGFADFAGAKSPFGVFAATQAPGQTPGRRIWVTQHDDTSEDAGRPKEQADDDEDHALKQAKSTVKPVTTHVTGEENEDTEMELKNVRLYVKRGEKPFAEGISGHCKLLKDRTTREERLLLRREPLWKISMNVRVNPSMRCSFDSTENVLRIVTQEPKSGVESATSPDEKSLEIVVYALKAGRSCSKQDFKVFSETLIKNPGLKQSISA